MSINDITTTSSSTLTTLADAAYIGSFNFTESPYLFIANSLSNTSHLTTPFINATNFTQNRTESIQISNSNFEQRFEFLVHGLLLFVIGAFGIMGNIVSIVVLSRPQMKSSINILLIGLVSYDTLLILTSIFLFSFRAFRYHGDYWILAYYNSEVYPFVLPVLYPIGIIAQTGSAYMTLCVTMERYVVVCWPLKSRFWCSTSSSRLAVICVILFSICYNIPRFFEITYRTVSLPVESSDMSMTSTPSNLTDSQDGVDNHLTNVTTNNYTNFVTKFEATTLRKNPTYISIYVTWMYLVFMYIIPFSALAIFNMCIFLTIKRANGARAQLSSQQKRDHNLAVMLLAVVITFFICNIMALINNILEAVFARNNQQLIQLSNMLVTINSSVNILIYCTFGTRFRKQFVALLTCQNANTLQTRAQSIHQQPLSTHLYNGGCVSGTSGRSSHTLSERLYNLNGKNKRRHESASICPVLIGIGRCPSKTASTCKINKDSPMNLHPLSGSAKKVNVRSNSENAITNGEIMNGRESDIKHNNADRDMHISSEGEKEDITVMMANNNDHRSPESNDCQTNTDIKFK